MTDFLFGAIDTDDTVAIDIEASDISHAANESKTWVGKVDALNGGLPTQEVDKVSNTLEDWTIVVVEWSAGVLVESNIGFSGEGFRSQVCAVVLEVDLVIWSSIKFGVTFSNVLDEDGNILSLTVAGESIIFELNYCWVAFFEDGENLFLVFTLSTAVNQSDIFLEISFTSYLEKILLGTDLLFSADSNNPVTGGSA